MKIALVGPVFPYRGGIAHYTALLTTYFQYQHETRLYSFKQQYPGWLFPGRSQLDPSGTPLAPVTAQRWLIPWWPLSWRRVARDWKAWQPDRVVIQWWVPFMAPMTAWLINRARAEGGQSILICHNVLPHETSRLDKALARLALSHADRLIVHSSAQQALAQTLLPDRLTLVVPHPSYADFRSTTWNRTRAREELGLTGNVLLFFGFVRLYKGLLDLLEALPQVVSEIRVMLLVVGEVWGDDAIYRTRIKELGLEAQVQFVNRYVSNDEAAMYFAAADLVVLPYREATGSGVLQLAFGLGAPVVATRTGGMDEVVEDGVTGFLVEPGDVNGLSRAIARFFREDRATSFRTAIANVPARFEWNGLVDAIVAEC
jgi:glycosyltransferase involved in cell wall biosynthesis